MPTIKLHKHAVPIKTLHKHKPSPNKTAPTPQHSRTDILLSPQWATADTLMAEACSGAACTTGWALPEDNALWNPALWWFKVFASLRISWTALCIHSLSSVSSFLDSETEFLNSFFAPASNLRLNLEQFTIRFLGNRKTSRTVRTK